MSWAGQQHLPGGPAPKTNPSAPCSFTSGSEGQVWVVVPWSGQGRTRQADGLQVPGAGEMGSYRPGLSRKLSWDSGCQGAPPATLTGGPATQLRIPCVPCLDWESLCGKLPGVQWHPRAVQAAALQRQLQRPGGGHLGRGHHGDPVRERHGGPAAARVCPTPVHGSGRRTANPPASPGPTARHTGGDV